jgi:hypothetical protein
MYREEYGMVQKIGVWVGKISAIKTLAVMS